MTVETARRQFGEALKAKRRMHALSLRDLQQQAGVPFAAVSMIESGQRAIGPDHAAKIADALKLAHGERDDFLKLAARTVTARGRKQTATGCPPLLAQRFAEHLAFVLGTDLVKLDSFGCIQFPSLSAFPEAGVPAPRLFYACEKGGKLAPLKPAVWEHIRLHRSFPVLTVVFMRDGRQAVIQCGAQFF